MDDKEPAYTVRQLIDLWKANYVYNPDHRDPKKIPIDKERDGLLNILFTTLKDNGYSYEDISVYKRDVTEYLAPRIGSAYDKRVGKDKANSWRWHASNAYDMMLVSIMVPKEALAKEPTKIERAEAPKIDKKDKKVEEPEFYRVSKDIDLKLVTEKGPAAAAYSPDPEVCDILNIPEEWRE